MIKRVISIILSLVFALQTLNIVAFADESVPKVFQIEICSFDFKDSYAFVYDINGKFYMTIQDISELTRYNEKETDDELIIYQGVREISINKKTHKMNDSNLIDQGKVPFVEYNGTYLLECIPMLTYLGAECTLEGNKLYVNMPRITIWEAIDYKYSKYNLDITTWAGNVKSQKISLTCDLIMEIFNPFSNLGLFSGTDEYIDDVLYTVLDVDINQYDSVSRCIANDNMEMNSFINKTPELLDGAEDVVDIVDKINNSDDEIYKMLRNSVLNEQIFKNEMLYNYYKNEGDIQKCSEISRKLNQSVCEQVDLKCNSSKGISKIDMLTLALGTASTFMKYATYDNDAKYLYANTINDEICSDTGIDPKWKSNAEHITQVLSSKPSMFGEAVSDEVSEFIVDKINEQGIEWVMSSLVDDAAGVYSIIPGIANYITAMIYSDMLEAYSSDRRALFLANFQNTTALMISELLKDEIRKEHFQSEKKLTNLKNMYLLYYKMTIAYFENVEKSVDEFGGKNKNTFIQNLKERSNMVAEQLYNITNCTIIPIKSYKEMKDDVFTNTSNLTDIEGLFTPYYWYYNDGQIKFIEYRDSENNIVYAEAFDNSGRLKVSGVPKENPDGNLVITGKDYIDIYHNFENIERKYYLTDFYYSDNRTVFKEILYMQNHSFFISSLNENYASTGLEEYDSSSKLKSVQEYILNEFEQPVEWNMYDENRAFYEYAILKYEDNLSEFPTEELDYSSDGVLVRTKKYHSKGIISETVVYYENGEVSSITRYDLIGQIINRIYYYPNGIIQLEDSFDENGKRYKSIWYNEQGIIECVGEYNYDEELIVAYWYDAQGNVIDTKYYY